MATTPLSDCPFALEPVFIPDADHLARAVDFPASESGPLFRLIFRRPSVDFSKPQKDEITRWYSKGIKDTIVCGRTCLRKMRQGDRTLVGLAGWVVERNMEEEQTNSNENKTAAKETKAGGEQKTVRQWMHLHGQRLRQP